MVFTSKGINPESKNQNMKPWTINPAFALIESTDLYFIESHNKWYSVPKHWIGDFVISHSYAIKSRNSK